MNLTEVCDENENILPVADADYDNWKKLPVGKG